MRKLITSILSLLTALIAVVPVYSQAYTTYSPYSRYGVGEIRPQGYAFTRAMGGLSQGVRSHKHVNYLNPASYTAQDTLSFIFDFAVEGNVENYEQANLSSTMNTGNLHHLAIQFPVTKWFGASLGLQPYSDVGYNIRQTQMDDEILSSIGTVKRHNTGEGGITQMYAGTAFQPFKFLSVGANLSYLFGAIEHNSEVLFPADKPNYYDTYTDQSLVIRNLAYSFGAQFTFFMGNDNQYRLIFGGTLDNKSTVDATSTTHYTYHLRNRLNTIEYTEDDDASFTIPHNFSFGFTLSHKNRLQGGLEYSLQDWSNTQIFNYSESLARSQTMRAGLEYTPNRFHLRSYMRRVSYRAGVRYTDTYLIMKDNQINDMALTFGLGLPFRRTNTSFNLSFEVGRKGTLENDLVQQTYGIINLGVSFYDLWFYRPKYN